MRRVIVLCFLAALAAASMLTLSPTPASAFGWCGGGYATARAGIAPRAYRPYYRSRVYRGRYIRPGLRRR